jgi:FAD/FMN-containing dehydrogenase
MALEEAQIDLMRRVKTAFDPNLILNPGKVLP